jgi:hypothetical protein
MNITVVMMMMMMMMMTKKEVRLYLGVKIKRKLMQEIARRM